MSWDINNVVVVGRLTRDPELTHTPAGKAVCHFAIASNRGEEVSFFNVVAWNKTAEAVDEYLTKGKRCALEGRLEQRTWTGKDGKTRSEIEIVASTVQFLEPKTGAEEHTANEKEEEDAFAKELAK